MLSSFVFSTSLLIKTLTKNLLRAARKENWNIGSMQQMAFCQQVSTICWIEWFNFCYFLSFYPEYLFQMTWPFIVSYYLIRLAKVVCLFTSCDTCPLFPPLFLHGRPEVSKLLDVYCISHAAWNVLDIVVVPWNA